MRKLVKTLLSLSLMAPAAALALGLGDIKLNSALNQRLDAEIELLSVDPAEADAIEVSLASAETFSKIGLERPAILMLVKFDVHRTEGGRYYVKATSREVIREPFLDFLVEVKWPSGRVLREYTLLLDPPVSYREEAPAISVPDSGTATSTAQTDVAEAEEEFVPPPSSIPVATETETTEMAAEPDTTAEMAPEPAPAATPEPRKELVYGPVKANDTLWAIALKMRPNRDISPQQMMMALLKANPHAFFNNNVNRLKKGYVLRIDDPALLTAMNKAEAARQIARQTRDWQDFRAAAAEKAAERQPAADADAPAASATAERSEPKLKLVAPAEESSASGSAAEGEASGGDVNEELMLALESSAAQRKENEELESRVQDLEAQLQDMQRLLTLKDDDLATLQKQLREQGQEPALPSDEVAESEADAVEMPAAEDEGAGVAEEPDGAAAVTDEADEAVEEKAEDSAPEAAASTQPQTSEKPAAEPKPKAAAPQPKPQAKPAPQPTFIESLMQDPLMLAAGGGTLILLLVLGLVMARRRRKGGFQESILSGGTSSMLNAKADEAGGETSFLSDLAISGMGSGAITTDEGEVDPLTEADVFMAYGRNQQAEEVLKKALESSPERPDIIAKLLEVYHSGKDNEQFEALINQSGEKLKQNEGLWSRIVPMGQELLPAHALFAGAESHVAQAGAPAQKNEAPSEDVLDIGLDLDEISAEMEGEAGDDSFDLGMDLDFDEDNKAEKKPAEDSSSMDFDLELGTESDTAAESGDLEFDLGDFGGAEEQSTAESAAEELTDLEFDMGDFAAESESQPSTEEEAFDLDFGQQSSGGDSAAEEDTLDLGDLEFGDLQFGGEEESADAGTEADALDLGSLESSDDFGDFGDLDDESMLDDNDEITTKLDLAQAYIEMGDNEGARSMLEEVVEAGDAEQKQQAQQLLSKI